MGLTQATNITPSVAGSGALGAGVVDAAQGLTISWQVNGTSPMVAYRAVIYLNDAASTQKYTTGKVALSTPFYGKDALGQQQFFSFAISANTLQSAGITNGGQYKFILTQWWGATDAESITQSSAAVFITRAAPSLTMNAIPDPIPSNRYTFSASYAQAQGDAADRVRWRIARIGEEDAPLYDSGALYTQLLECEFDRLLSAEDEGTPNYAVRCTVETVSGVSADTGWVNFTAYYEISEQTWLISAACVPQTGAVRVSWPRIVAIEGTASGDYTIQGGQLSLPDGSSITWNTVGTQPMDFSAPWTAAWRGSVMETDADLLTLTMGEHTLRLHYYASGSAAILLDNLRLAQMEDVPNGAEMTVILTPSGFAWNIRYIDVYDGGLFPSETLYPNALLYPNRGNYHLESGSAAAQWAQGSITAVGISGAQVCDWLNIVMGELDAQTKTAMLTDSSFEPDFDADTYFLARFRTGLSAGVIETTGIGITGYSVYRRNIESGEFLHLAELGEDSTEFYDYGLRNGAGDYRWRVYAKDSSGYLLGIDSAAAGIFQWDWTLLQCSETQNGYFAVNAVFRFGKNLASGSISNGNAPALYANFTRYPTVLTSPQNYQSGTLTSLIGVIGMQEDGSYGYMDTRAQRDAIFALSVTTDALFLKSRKGDLMRVRLSGAVGMETMDASPMQAQTASIPWSEIGDASEAALLAFAPL